LEKIIEQNEEILKLLRERKWKYGRAIKEKNRR
jgi:hypothetical protein